VANGAASVAVTVPSGPAYESVMVTVLLVEPSWVSVNSAEPEAVPLGVKAAALFQVAVAVFLPV
jgi:hypothetical protein